MVAMLKLRPCRSGFYRGAPGPSQPAEVVYSDPTFGGAPREVAPAQERPMRQLLLDFTRAPAPTFANFVHGANAEAAHALESAARGECAERVIYVWGESGAGKSHLLRAFAEASGARLVPGAH